MALTGKFEFRKTVWGKIVLRVEEEVKPFWSRSLKRRWRDAMLMDLAAPEMRHLVDMRRKPWSRHVSPPAPRLGSERQHTELPALADVVAAAAQQDGQELRATH